MRICPGRKDNRKGQVLVISAFSLIILGLLAALTIDVGHMFASQAQIQNAGDAASKAAVFTLLSERHKGSTESAAREAATEEAQAIAALNVSEARCKIAFGHYDPATSQFTSDGTSTPATSVNAQIIRDGQEGSESLGLFFASLAGINDIAMTSTATTRGSNKLIGFEPGGGLRPFAVPKNIIGDWDTGESVSVPVPSQTKNNSENDEENTYEDFMAAGNWGWLNLDGGANGVPELRKWIDEGYDDTFVLDQQDSDGEKCTFVEGTPGLRSTLQSDIDELVGEEIICCIYDDVSGEGANAQFRIVGFIGLKITGTNWGNGNKDGELEAELIGISDNPKAILGGSGGSEESNLYKVQLVE